jgi:hypothetical protein
MKKTQREFVSRRQLEDLLSQVLVPVEPDIQFVRTLKARLVNYRGSGIGPIWGLAFGVGMATVITVATLGLTLRVILAILGILGSLSRQQTEAGAKTGAVSEA